MNNYQDFLKQKQRHVTYSGFDVEPSDVSPHAFLFQRDIIRWACKLGRAAVFAECGLGKTLIQLEWARLVAQHTGGKVLILAPPAVAMQTVNEGQKFGIEVNRIYDASDQLQAINITNYERVHKFDMLQFVAIVLDESSILKNYGGKTRNQLQRIFETTEYKLACTATPSPNDHVELASHSHWLGIMNRGDVLSQWFVNDYKKGDWRLKGHAENDFWRWVTSWAVCISVPSDLGAKYHMPEFKLPPMNIIEHLIAMPQESIERAWEEGRLIPDSRPSSTNLHKVQRESLEDRLAEVDNIMSTVPDNEPVILWCFTNDESKALKAMYPEAVEVKGSDSIDIKEQRLQAFSNGDVRIIITKPSIAGFGLNWQHCHYQIFVGASFSFEALYQAMKRVNRFGQNHEVDTHLIYSETIESVSTAIQIKSEQFKELQDKMNKAMRKYGLFRNGQQLDVGYNEEMTTGRGWEMINGDCVEVVAQMPDDSVDFSIYSPPFSDFFTFSDSLRDMSNVRNDDEFFEHYTYLLRDLYRVTRPHRLTAVHCKALVNHKNATGEISLRDFPGDIIRAHQEAGWVYHAEFIIPQNPEIEQRMTKAQGLLHKTFASDSTKVRNGRPDKLLIFKKYVDGDNPEPVVQRRKIGDYIGTDLPWDGLNEYRYSIEVWNHYANAVWYDIDQTNVLNFKIAKTAKDEKHLVPLQLDVSKRAIQMYSNEGDIVLSPFAGIGSEGDSAIRLNRQFIGIELKPEYYNHACKFLQDAVMESQQPTLFDGLNFG